MLGGWKAAATKMGEPTTPTSALLLLSVMSRYAEALTWARQRAEETWSEVALVSRSFPFAQTTYYAPTMGDGIQKTFLCFARPFPLDELANAKLLTNQWEVEYAALGRHPESRPLNLDPGYLTQSKLVLASTKDFAHRIYLNRGIFAEITLFYQGGRWEPHRWTFPDFRQAEYHAFFDEARRYLRARKSGESA